MLLHCDQAAAMSVDEEVLAFHAQCCRLAGINQESVNPGGYEVRKALEGAGEELVRDLTGREDFTVCWADSGTGIFNLLYHTGILNEKQILTSRLEHPALNAVLKRSKSHLRSTRALRESPLRRNACNQASGMNRCRCIPLSIRGQPYRFHSLFLFCRK